MDSSKVNLVLTIALVIGVVLLLAVVVAELIAHRGGSGGPKKAKEEGPKTPPKPATPSMELRAGLYVDQESPDARPGCPRTGEFFPLQEGSFEAGRAPVSRLQDRSDVLKIDEPYVTRSHFKIDYVQDLGLYRIQDLGSKNGTVLGEVDLEKFVVEFLQHDDLIRIGNGMVLRFHQPSVRVHRQPPDRSCWGDLRFSGYIADGGFARIFEGNLMREPKPSAVMERERDDAEAQRRLRLSEKRPLKVAIKVPKDYENPGDGQIQIIRESEVIADLLHPNIIWMVSAGTLGNTDLRYLTYEYMPNGNLRELMAQKKKMSEPEVREIAGQISAALIYIHSKGIIHCDLKPDNVLFDEQKRVRLTDFGNSRTAEDPWASEFGHPGYSSPEHNQSALERTQIRLTPASDVYSFGVILYEMLVGNRPCAPDESTFDHKPYRPPREFVEISSELDNIVMRMLSADPLDRPRVEDLFEAVAVSG